ncbi:hypothetical protein GCM10008119_36700 [Pedobacter mendelii]|uniref:Uncharacterized protein n=1 Tax=Pedobacter mendelii TaxID=1908240 RepID=A0ABQ2BLU5_9SPHI|nr:hypothetical protein GCM10008119_36700 [Pedobacter mendelii]
MIEIENDGIITICLTFTHSKFTHSIIKKGNDRLIELENDGIVAICLTFTHSKFTHSIIKKGNDRLIELENDGIVAICLTFTHSKFTHSIIKKRNAITGFTIRRNNKGIGWQNRQGSQCPYFRFA